MMETVRKFVFLFAEILTSEEVVMAGVEESSFSGFFCLQLAEVKREKLDF
jgi:hypothetical protein